MYTTAVGKLLYMRQERADIMYSVKETGRRILCPTESDEMNIKSSTRYLDMCQECKVLDRNHYIPAVRERGHRQRLAKTAHAWFAIAQAAEFRSGKTQLFLLYHDHKPSVSLSSAEAQLYALTTGLPQEW